MLIETLLPFIGLPIFIVSIMLHEISHGQAAQKFGDFTARNAGRITLNPIKHIDPVGSVLVPGLLLISGANSVFGWAKPIPVSMDQLTRYQQIRVAGAGIVTNIILAMIGIVILFATRQFMTPEASIGVQVLCMGGFLLFPINIVLAVFNLLPIPPLDGWVILTTLASEKLKAQKWIAHPAVTLCCFAGAFLIMRYMIAHIITFVRFVTHLPVL